MSDTFIRIFLNIFMNNNKLKGNLNSVHLKSQLNLIYD